MNACPKCGGSNGYVGNLTMSYDMQGFWGEEWQTTGSERVVFRPRNVRCADCGARFTIEKASGEIRDNEVNNKS